MKKNEHRPNVLIIGAGLAGISAARQLQCYGFDVEIVEARSRLGGRCFTMKEGEINIDLGNS
jgi:monoamine oxidase